MMTVDRINTAFEALKMAAEATGLNVQEVENMRVLAVMGYARQETIALPRMTLAKWKDAIDKHWSSSDGEEEWNNDGVIETSHEMKAWLAGEKP